MTARELDDLREVYAHLGAALIQSIPSDDQIIMGHIRVAQTLLESVLRHANDPDSRRSATKSPP